MVMTVSVNLDPALNRLPENIHRIHLMGICGTGMGALAGMLKDSGYLVTGSDQNVYPPMSDFLAGLGIEVSKGYAAANLKPVPDLVVVGNVINRQNEEAAALAALELPYLSLPQAVRLFFLRGKTSLVVTGTHGKTTTASMLASILDHAGRSPGFLIGGLVQGFARNFNLGSGPCFVVEGDEYDTAFFDKGPKFLHYDPKIAILTSIEFDHADIYENIEAVIRSFRRLVSIMPANGVLVACHDSALVREVAGEASCRVVWYGSADDSDWRIADLDDGAEHSSFIVIRHGEVYGKFVSPMPGRHNGLNALSVIAVLDHLGVGVEKIGAGLAAFKGVKRRQEVRGNVGGVTVIDDFAHHPTAVRETLSALAARYRGRRLVAVFEPRTNSSRRRVFQQDYVVAFDGAQRVLVKEPDPLKNVAPELLFSSAELADDLRKRGLPAQAFPGTDAILDDLAVSLQRGDVVAILSNGGFDNIHSRLLDILANRNATG